MAVERTTNPYATYGPGDTDESWAEYFRRVKRSEVRDDLQRDGSDSGGTESSGDEPESGDSELQLLQSENNGLELLSDPPGALIAYQKLLIKRGFDIRLGWFRQFEEGRIYGDKAAKAGQKAPDRTLDTVWITAYKPHKLMKMTYERVNGGKWSCAWRQINKQLVPVSDKQMKEWVNDVEEQEAPSAGAAAED